MDEGTIGARLRALRSWRKLTLKELADQAGLSESFLSRVERGQRVLDRRSHIAALATALRVSETELTGGPHLTEDPVQSNPHSYIPALRVALHANTLSSPTISRARPLDALMAEMTHVIEPLRRASDYIEIGERLPAVLDELHLHVAEPVDENAHRAALEILIEACVCTCFTAKNLRYPDLAQSAATKAREAAALLGDPVQQGKADFLRVQTMPRNAWERTLTVAERAAEALQPHATGQLGIEVLGMLTLNASLAAATLNNGGAADHWITEARELAHRVPDEPTINWQSFSHSNVGAWQVAVAVERGMTGGAVLGLAEEVQDKANGLGMSWKKATFFADVGRGLARDPQTCGDAVSWLRRAERLAPQRIRNSAPVRETVAVMLEQARVAAGGRELRGMAARMGIPH